MNIPEPIIDFELYFELWVILGLILLILIVVIYGALPIIWKKYTEG